MEKRIDIESVFYQKVKNIIADWKESGIYAISFFVYSNEAYEYQGYRNVSEFLISYNTEQDCGQAGALDEKRWNYAFWRQDVHAIVDIYEGDEGADLLFKWYHQNNIKDIGFEDPDKMYDADFRYTGRGPAGHYELITIAANVANRLQRDGVIAKRFGKAIPIIVQGLEYTWFDIEATKKANPGGEAETFLQYITKKEMA